MLLKAGRGIETKILDDAGRKRIKAQLVSKVKGGS
jgi:hypothetical protein